MSHDNVITSDILFRRLITNMTTKRLFEQAIKFQEERINNNLTEPSKIYGRILFLELSKRAQLTELKLLARAYANNI